MCLCVCLRVSLAATYVGLYSHEGGAFVPSHACVCGCVCACVCACVFSSHKLISCTRIEGGGGGGKEYIHVCVAGGGRG